MTRAQNLILLHFVVLIFGFTGILGKLISLDSVALVWYRMTIAAVCMVAYLVIFRRRSVGSLKGLWKTLLTGILVALHWIAFFEAIQQSNVSVTLATMSATALFVALLNPFFSKVKFLFYEIVLGLAAVGGLLLIFGFESQYKWGIILALASSALAALFTVINAELVKVQSSLAISTWEMLAGAVVVFAYIGLTKGISVEFFTVSAEDWLWLILLGVVATAFAFVVSVEVMKALSPFTVAISVNLEPVYSIILALVIFGAEEQMSPGFYIGALIILLTIVINAWLKKRSVKRLRQLS